MYHFLNLKEGQITIDTFRNVNATLTDVMDIADAVRNETGEILTAGMDTEEEIATALRLEEEGESWKA